MTTATAPFRTDMDTLTADIEALVGAEDSGDTSTELAAAANFAFRYGTLGELFETVELHRAQAARRVPAAWGLLAHWSITRGDPAPREGMTVDQLCPGCWVCPALEDVYAQRGYYVAGGRCDACGGGLTTHAIAVVLGKPYAACCGRWQRAEPLVADAGQVVDDQISEAFSARWVAALANTNWGRGLWAVVTRSYYVAHKDDGRVVLQRDDHYQVATDPIAVNDNEVASFAMTHTLDSGHPQAEDLQALAADSFPPEPGEWQAVAPSPESFANGGWLDSSGMPED
jgi:hypothetical protein